MDESMWGRDCICEVRIYLYEQFLTCSKNLVFLRICTYKKTLTKMYAATVSMAGFYHSFGYMYV